MEMNKEINDRLDILLASKNKSGKLNMPKSKKSDKKNITNENDINLNRFKSDLILDNKTYSPFPIKKQHELKSRNQDSNIMMTNLSKHNKVFEENHLRTTNYLQRNNKHLKTQLNHIQSYNKLKQFDTPHNNFVNTDLDFFIDIQNKYDDIIKKDNKRKTMRLKTGINNKKIDLKNNLKNKNKVSSKNATISPNKKALNNDNNNDILLSVEKAMKKINNNNSNNNNITEQNSKVAELPNIFTPLISKIKDENDDDKKKNNATFLKGLFKHDKVAVSTKSFKDGFRNSLFKDIIEKDNESQSNMGTLDDNNKNGNHSKKSSYFSKLFKNKTKSSFLGIDLNKMAKDSSKLNNVSNIQSEFRFFKKIC